jgi:hypothetical protein
MNRHILRRSREVLPCSEPCRPNWVCFAQSLAAGARPEGRGAREGRPGIGFVSQNRLLPARHPPEPQGHPSLGLYRIFRPPGTWPCPSRAQIGFVSHVCPPSHTPAAASRLAKLGSFCTFDPRSWVCFYSRLPATDYRLPPFGFVSHESSPPRHRGHGEGRRGISAGPVAGIRASPRCASSYCSLPPQIINHNSSIITRRGSASEQTIPLSMGRVARIVPEFWAQTMPENGATHCCQGNNEFFGRGVLYLFNCCTNGAPKAGGSRLEAGGSRRASVPLAKELHSTAEDAEGRRGNRTKDRFRAETPRRREGPLNHGGRACPRGGGGRSRR